MPGGFGRGYGRRQGIRFGFRGSSPPWPYLGLGRGANLERRKMNNASCSFNYR